jgi:hypothetical protein
VLVGILRPLILLPASVLTDLSPTQLELLLLHELAHVRRWDNLVNLIQRLAEGLLFFHPGVWLVSRWLRLEREHCCDAIVLRHANRPRAYVETLASFAVPGLAPRYAAAVAANHQLVSRVRRILNPEDRTMRPAPAQYRLSLGSSIAVLMLLAALSTVLAADRKTPPAAAAQPEDAAQPTAPAVPNSADIARQPKPEAAPPERLDPAAEPLRSYRRTRAGAAPGADVSNFLRGGLTRRTTPALRAAPQEADRPWGPEQALGEPNVPQASDDGRAWASLSPDGQNEWLELRYNTPVSASQVAIYESYNPGAVSAVTVTDVQGNNYLLFSGPDPSRGFDMAVLVVDLPRPITIVSVRIELASKDVPGWNEIDAVGLVDATSGRFAWADAARASSTFAEPAAPGLVQTTITDEESELVRLRREVEDLRRKLEDQATRQPAHAEPI